MICFLTGSPVIPGTEILNPANDTINWVSRDVAWLTEHKAELLAKWNAIYAETH